LLKVLIFGKQVRFLATPFTRNRKDDRVVYFANIELDLFNFFKLKPMKRRISLTTMLLAFILIGAIGVSAQQQLKKRGATKEVKTLADPLASWNEGASKSAIVDFVTKTTKEGSADFIPVEDRIACFDNDGTLWSEQPYYYQLLFAFDRIKVLAPQHPEWTATEPFASVLKGDIESVKTSGEASISQIIFASHTGLTTDEFNQVVKDWITTAKHPSGRLYTDMVYVPMLELINYLKANEYKVFIVSGGEIDFMRAWMERVYGIPPYQIVGTSLKMKYEWKEDKPVLMKYPALKFYNDRDDKVVGIHEHIGKRPVFTGGNSDGDYGMLQWTTTSTGYPRFGMIVHHTDSVREVSYDRQSSVGRLNKGLDDAQKFNFVIVDMKGDWKRIFAFE